MGLGPDLAKELSDLAPRSVDLEVSRLDLDPVIVVAMSSSGGRRSNRKRRPTGEARGEVAWWLRTARIGGRGWWRMVSAAARARRPWPTPRTKVEFILLKACNPVGTGTEEPYRRR